MQKKSGNTSRRFVLAALNDYSSVGALTPSSNHVVKKVLHYIPKRSRTVIEYGSGDGVLTKPLLMHLGKDACLVAVEINKEFIGILRNIIDARLRILHHDVRHIKKLLQVERITNIDCIVINIPLTFLTKKDRENILHEAYSLLSPGGTLVAYQYSPLIYPILKELSGAKLYTDFELRNFPPYFIFAAKKI